jgi:hypothetical protein
MKIRSVLFDFRIFSRRFHSHNLELPEVIALSVGPHESILVRIEKSQGLFAAETHRDKKATKLRATQTLERQSYERLLELLGIVKEFKQRRK